MQVMKRVERCGLEIVFVGRLVVVRSTLHTYLDLAIYKESLGTRQG